MKKGKTSGIRMGMFCDRLLMSLAVVLIPSVLLAQVKPREGGESAASAKAQALRKVAEVKDNPPAYIEALAKFAGEYPYDFETQSGPYWFRSVVPKPGVNTGQVLELVHLWVNKTEPLPAPLRAEFYGAAVRVLLENNLWREASDLAQKTISLLNEEEYIELARRRYERLEQVRKEKNPNLPAHVFSLTDQVDRFLAMQAAEYLLLGRSFYGQNKVADAEKAFRSAYEIRPAAESAVRIADVLEQRGETREALNFMTYAVLDGRATARDIEHFHALYRSLHQGKLDDVESYLDTIYRKTYQNPVGPQRYEPTSRRSNRAVLVEDFTGAGCIPCVSFDYALERMLSEYSRSELNLLVYHWNAPTDDPLANRSSDARLKYYEVNAAPELFVDGVRLMSANSSSGSRKQAETVAPAVFGEIEAQVRPRLEAAAKAHLKVEARRLGNSVNVSVAVNEIDGGYQDLRLQIALVENDVTYSGENGLRFQPMVVRSLAREVGAEKYGFDVDKKGAEVRYVFELGQIMAENVKYYQDWPKEQRAQMAKSIGEDAANSLDFSFREDKHFIDMNDISVVAFLQDDHTKEILQTAYTKPEATADSAKEITEITISQNHTAGLSHAARPLYTRACR